ncbi:MAG: cell surface protein SprA, partial [Bacteroidaceae bacterium]|nr:cell surface protein SprA [Bacteroidaceae bacterium]
ANWLRIVRDFGINYLPQSIAFNSDINRHYYELQERDMEQLDNHTLPLSFASDFLWNRSFQLRWDPTKLIHFNFSSATNAEIEQPNVPVNRDLYPDDYTFWKDSVNRSIRQFGRPLTYQQTADLSWNLPLNKIPVLDWITSDVKYSANYNWTRGALLANGGTLGNTIANQRNVNFNARFNLETFYNYVPFFKKVNRKFASSAPPQQKKELKRFDQEIQLKSDTSLVVIHNQRSKRLRITAIRPDGSRYPVRYKLLDLNRIEVLNRDTAKVKLIVVQRRPVEDEPWYRTFEYASRGLMMVRNVNISYRNTANMTLPGFLPEVGDAFGQHSMGGLLAPGLGFAFGTVGDDYIQTAAQRGWLLRADSVVTPAMTSLTEDLQIRSTIEPVRDLKFNLNFSRTHNRAKTIQYMFDGMPTTQTGSFTMTTLSLRSAFASVGSADNGYRSATFDKFVGLLDAYQQRIQSLYAGQNYPSGMGSLSGTPYDPANGAVDKYSSEVMIPAFLSAYGAGGSSLDIFPALTSLLPNWTLSYGGLSRLAPFKKYFKSFNLNHGYRSIYSVGAYNTYQSYREMQAGFGFVQAVATGMPTPSSMYDISTVTLNESFSPLLGLDMTFYNNMTLRLEMRRTRVLTLSMTNQQITESRSNDFVLGAGYKVNDFKLFKSSGSIKQSGRRSNARNSRAKEAASTPNVGGQTSSGFANALNLRLDISFRDQSAIQRNILTTLSQATSGNRAIQISFSADYQVSKMLTLSAYFDRQINRPLLTTSAYPSTTQDFGINLRFQLAR